MRAPVEAPPGKKPKLGIETPATFRNQDINELSTAQSIIERLDQEVHRVLPELDEMLCGPLELAKWTTHGGDAFPTLTAYQALRPLMLLYGLDDVTPDITALLEKASPKHDVMYRVWLQVQGGKLPSIAHHY